MEFIDPDVFLMKETTGGKTIAVRGKEEDFKIGEISNIECIESGKVTIQDGKGKDISIHWYYEPDNDEMEEVAEEFREGITIPFQIIEKKL